VQLAQIPVDTTELNIGMYVAMLDRPWQETPFVFQGFEIKDLKEIEQLQTYCSHVYVNVEKGKLTKAQILALRRKRKKPPARRPADAMPAAQAGFFRRLAAALGLGRLFGFRSGSRSLVCSYPTTATVRAEAPAAREAYESCVDCHATIVSQARRKGYFDMDALRQVTPALIDSVLRNPDAMAWTVFTGKRSSRKYSRAVATAVWSVMFGRHLGLDRSALESLAIGGLLLDIGNADLPEDIVNAEGAISVDEYDAVPRHVEAGIRIVNASGGAETSVIDMIRCHHERYDGSGYPSARSGSELPVFGRIAAIADCYDAMTTRPSYSPALAAYDAARELNLMRDKAFHAEVVEQFLHTIGMFPTGSIVELSNGLLGLVLEQNPCNPLRPKVLIVRDKNDGEVRERDVRSMEDLPTEGDGAVWIAQGHEHGAFGIDPLDYFN